MSDLITVLKHIEKRPGMYFRDVNRAHSIHILDAFITGFRCAQTSPDEPGLQFFTEWVAAHYRVIADARSYFPMILEHVGGDERLAYDEFFRLLPELLHDRENLGREGILSRFTEVQDLLWKEFRSQ